MVYILPNSGQDMNVQRRWRVCPYDGMDHTEHDIEYFVTALDMGTVVAHSRRNCLFPSESFHQGRGGDSLCFWTLLHA